MLPALCCLYEECPVDLLATMTCLKCTPLLVKKAGVAPEVTRDDHGMQTSVQVRDAPEV